MAVDVSGLRRAVDRWSADVHREAVGYVEERLTDAVPRGVGPRDGRQPLADSRQTSVGVREATIRYTAPHGALLESGTGPHIIRASSARVLRFVWPKSSSPTGLTFAAFVNHPGSTKHKGWWSRVMNDRAWRVALEAGARQARF